VRLAVCILGHEVLAVELAGGEHHEDAGGELAPPFGFSGSGGGQVERAEDWAPTEDQAGRQLVTVRPGTAHVRGWRW
jgi:hypothetical protein